MIDSYYTPPDLASRLLSYLKTLIFNNVVDFCIGDGELIRAAVNLWSGIRCYGTDISSDALRTVKKNHPNWMLEECNFLNKESRHQCKIIKEKKGGFDLILLNPPFSCAGGTIHEISIDGQSFKVSTAMKFLGESIKYLSSNGCLLAIMPINICYSQKDRKLREYLINNYNFSILETPNGNFFKKCSPNIVFVSINLREQPKKINNHRNYSCNLTNYRIFRGKLSVHEAKFVKEGLPFIHSTNLRNNTLCDLKNKVVNISSLIKGPAILIPRVGKPDLHKVCIIPNNEQYILSDCIIAIQTKNASDGEKIYRKLYDNWDFFQELYKGTGAKFITIERLDTFLSKPKEKKREDIQMAPMGTLEEHSNFTDEGGIHKKTMVFVPD